MLEEKQEVIVTENNQVAQPTAGNDIMQIDADELIYMAEVAEKRVVALDKIIKACFKITTSHDWVIIGGKPYLQESGTTKVANLIGISFEIAPGFPRVETDKEGYKTYYYRVRAYGKNVKVEGEGSRSMKEEFFAGKGEKRKQPEEIKERDVMIAALTNAKNNAIKAIIPGLRNIEIDTLEEAGFDINTIKGYTFKTGKDGGKTGQEEEFECEHCKKKLNGKTASFSQARFSGHIYCYDCQQKAAAAKLKKTGEVVDLPPLEEEN